MSKSLSKQGMYTQDLFSKSFSSSFTHCDRSNKVVDAIFANAPHMRWIIGEDRIVVIDIGYQD